MYRDFSESSKNNLLSLVSDVESEKWCDFTDWVGDRWFDFELWIGTLNIKNYVNNVNSYHKKVIDKNNTTKDNIEEIFAKVASIDRTYDDVFANVASWLNNWNQYISGLNDIVNPTNGNFNSKYIEHKMKSSYNTVRDSYIVCLRERMVQDIDGELIFDTDLIYEYIKKNPSEMTDEEQALLVEVIAKLKDTVAFYETLATYGTDEFGVDILTRAAWITKDERFASFTAVSAHYNDIYVDLLKCIYEHSEDADTFAFVLATVGVGDNVLKLLGSELTLDGIFGTNSFKAYLAKYESEHSEVYYGKLEASESLEFNSEYKGKLDKHSKKFKNNKEKLEQKMKDKGLYDEYKDSFNLKNGKKLTKKQKDKFLERKMTLAEFNAGVNGTVSVYDGSFDTPLGGTLDVTVCEAEAHASISGGLYLMGNDGRKVVSPGVKAEVGASVTGTRAEYENQLLGNEMLGVNADASVEALSASASGELEIGFLDKDKNGNIVFDPQINAGVKAEAVLVEAEGSIGVNVLGGEASIGGSVKVGVGAHAEVGYKDGVFKCDVGASLGVGFDVNIEIDVGGMVDTVADAAVSAWDGLKKGWNSFWGK